jgi:hypothetical protein
MKQDKRKPQYRVCVSLGHRAAKGVVWDWPTKPSIQGVRGKRSPFFQREDGCVDSIFELHVLCVSAHRMRERSEYANEGCDANEDVRNATIVTHAATVSEAHAAIGREDRCLQCDL